MKAPRCHVTDPAGLGLTCGRPATHHLELATPGRPLAVYACTRHTRPGVRWAALPSTVTVTTTHPVGPTCGGHACFTTATASAAA